MSKYSIHSLSSSSSKIKEQMRRHFVDSSISSGKVCIVSNILQTFLCAFTSFISFISFVRTFMFVICVYLCCFDVINELQT